MNMKVYESSGIGPEPVISRSSHQFTLQVQGPFATTQHSADAMPGSEQLSRHGHGNAPSCCTTRSARLCKRLPSAAFLLPMRSQSFAATWRLAILARKGRGKMEKTRNSSDRLILLAQTTSKVIIFLCRCAACSRGLHTYRLQSWIQCEMQSIRAKGPVLQQDIRIIAIASSRGVSAQPCRSHCTQNISE